MINSKELLGGDRVEQAAEIVVYVLAIFLAIELLWYAWELPFETKRQANIFLGPSLAIFYLLKFVNHGGEEGSKALDIAGKRSNLLKVGHPYIKYIFILFAALSIFTTIYIEFHYYRLQDLAPIRGYTTIDHIVGLGIIFLVTDATRRAYGNIFASVTIFAILYAYFGRYFPGIMYHSGMSWEQIAVSGAMSLDGVYSFILEVGATWAAIFILFAGMIKAYGALDFILDLSNELGKLLKGGTVQLAIIASMIMGSVTGSAAANTATTGSFTIPIIKQEGVKKDYAAAIEAVASSGGQMLPPIMGIAAFLMVDLLNVRYLTIIQAGAIPAALYYFAVCLSTYLIISKKGWVSSADGKFDRSIIRDGVHYSVPFFVLIYTLIISGYTPLSAGLYTIAALVVTIPVYNIITYRSVRIREVSRDTFKGFKKGMEEMAPLAAVLATMGFVVTILTSTGLAQEISLYLVSFSGEGILLVLIIAMIGSILFGLGMPTPAAYLIVVILIAPALIELGIRDISAHMFVFYFAMLSAITPPVAIAVAVGTQIAKSNFLRSCWQAMKIGLAGFVIPFIFIYNEPLIYWQYPATIIELLFAVVGITALVVSTIGYNGFRNISKIERMGYCVMAVPILFSEGIIRYVFVLIFLMVLLLTSYQNLKTIKGLNTKSD